jgi:hypothetical protein
MADELSIEDAKTLLALCASGRLYAIEELVGARRSLQVPRPLRKRPLQIAFATGFHSLIELLLRHAPSQQAKNDALREAVHRRRPDLIDLALAYGAEIATIPFVDVLGTADKGSSFGARELLELGLKFRVVKGLRRLRLRSRRLLRGRKGTRHGLHALSQRPAECRPVK